MEVKQILVIQNKRIGDVLISSVLATNIKKVFPNSKVTFFVYDYTTGVIENNPAIDHIISVKEKKLKKPFELLKMAFKIRSKKYDIIFDPYAKFQSRILCLISGATYRIGLKRAHKNLKLPFYSHPVNFLPKSEHISGKAIEDKIHMIRSVFPLENPDFVPKIYLTDSEKKYTGLAGVQKPVVMLGVLGSTPQKSMPYAYVAALVDYVTSNYNVTVLFNYAPHQKTEALKIYELCTYKEQINLEIYEDGIRGFVKLISHCDLLIANEGGSVHITKAVNVPTFTIYSPYINKKSWCSFEDGKMHQSIHLLEEQPNLYETFTHEERKKIEADPQQMYLKLTPQMILEKLAPFLAFHLKPFKK